MFQKFLISKDLMEKKGGCSRTSFSIENFWSHGAKMFVKEPYTVSLNSSTEKRFG